MGAPGSPAAVPPAEPAAPATPAPAATPSWTEGMAAEDVGFIENKGWKGPGEMLTSYRHAEHVRGMSAESVVELPKDPDNAEQMGAFYTRLGRPESAEKYELPEAQVGEGSVDLAPKFREWAFAAGLNQRQTRAIFDAYQTELQTIVQGQTEAQNQNVQVAEQQMRTEWGAEYEANMGHAKRFAAVFGLSEQWLEAIEGGLASEEDPSGAKGLWRGAAKIGRALSEHKFPGEAVETTELGTTPAVAQTQINELHMDKDFLAAYQNRNNPGHQAAKDKMSRLHQLAYPGEQT